MDPDALMLSRIQFAFTISFHILFPSFTVGLACWIAVLEARWLMTGRAVLRTLSEFWTTIFAISFGMGVVSGIVMSYQFGTNWAAWSDVVGNVLAPLIQYEVVTAFFLESAFLGIMLFGRSRVPRWMHFTAVCLVALGTILSTFWILSANSWMQTPAGAELVEGRFFVRDWWAVVFNPSFPYRLAHMVTAMLLTTGFVVAGFSAWYRLRGVHLEEARIGYRMALWAITVLAPLQILIGDLHGLNTLEHQPAKIAAIEGNWETRPRAPLVLFAIPDEAAETNRAEIAVPGLASIVLTHDPNGIVPGLRDWEPQDRPPVLIPFYAFRLMVGIGLIMLAVGVVHVVLRIGGRLDAARWFQRIVVACTPLGFVAVLAGWFVTEVGRQPWTVYGLLRTGQSVTPALTAPAAMTSLAAYVIAYAAIYLAGTYYLVKLLRKGPGATADPAPGGGPQRPLSRSNEPMET
jgi:cytochrome bd ubiquinol oxidase subunit I